MHSLDKIYTFKNNKNVNSIDFNIFILIGQSIRPQVHKSIKTIQMNYEIFFEHFYKLLENIRITKEIATSSSFNRYFNLTGIKYSSSI